MRALHCWVRIFSCSHVERHASRTLSGVSASHAVLNDGSLLFRFTEYDELLAGLVSPQNQRSVHFVGIGGTGMSALARVAMSQVRIIPGHFVV